jgi:hypothetical protein
MTSEEDNEEAADTTACCASCGIAEIDDIKLKECDGCDLVRYCSDDCQRSHKSEHEEDCKKRAAELRDEILFTQPESSHYGDCLICSLPLSLETKKSAMYMCCSKVICNGCNYTNQMRERERRLASSCPFCRKPLPETDEEENKRIMKRVEANDPVAMRHQGGERHNKGDYHCAFEYWTKAAGLGDAVAHHNLAVLYHDGDGVEKDEGKEVYHLEEAAIGGHPEARCDLGAYEWRNGNIERAMKHLIIAATQGHDESIKWLMIAFKGGIVIKDDLDSALRAYQAAVEATKSPQREEAEEFYRTHIV